MLLVHDSKNLRLSSHNTSPPAAPAITTDAPTRTAGPTGSSEPLFTLAQGGELVEATVVRRPSARNKSPYVGDVELRDGRIALAHMPSLDVGGKCLPGAQVRNKRDLIYAKRDQLNNACIHEHRVDTCLLV